MTPIYEKFAEALLFIFWTFFVLVMINDKNPNFTIIGTMPFFGNHDKYYKIKAYILIVVFVLWYFCL